MDHLIICYLTLLTLTLIESSYIPNGSANRFPQLQRVLDRLATDTRQYSSTYHHHVTTAPYRHAGARHQQKAMPDDEYDDDHVDEDDDEEEEEEDQTARPRKPPARLPVPDEPSEPEMTAYSNYKWVSLGNRQAIDKMRNNHLSSTKSPPRFSISEDQTAKHHAIRINQEGQCRHPRPKVIRVSDVFPHPGKTYVPQCTILHRCGDDTGCCRSTHTCVAKKSVKVELFFHSTFHGGMSANQVDRLVFTNDTECMCQDKRDEMMPRDMAVTGGHQPPITSLLPSSGTCRCPKLFAVRQLSTGFCSCDCFDNDRDCLRQKKGKEYLTHDDKQCVARLLCQPPTCEYGSYRAHAGRCSKRHEKYHAEY